MMTENLPFLNLLGFLILGFAYIFVQWRYGQNKASAEIIATYREQVNLNSAEIQKLVHEVGVLTGKLAEKDARIKTLEDIFQGRNPEQAQYMEDMRNFTAGVAKYMEQTSKILDLIYNNMVVLNKRG